MRAPYFVFLLSLQILLCLSPHLPRAESATRAEAEQVCRNWLAYVVFETDSWAGSYNPTILDVKPIADGDGVLGWNFLIAPQGHIVVPVLKELPPIKAYSETSNLDADAEDGFARLLRESLRRTTDFFVDAYGSLEAAQPATGDILLDPGQRQEWERLLVPTHQFYAALQSGRDHNPLSGTKPLLRSSWAQGYPYNVDCPVGANENICLVGCVATATAQIMRYHEWPPAGTGTKSYYWNGDQSCSGISTPGETLVATLSDPYDWDNMLDDYRHTHNLDQRRAVRELCYEVGVAFSMDYGTCWSGAWTYDAKTILPDMFGYSYAINRANRSDHDPITWSGLIKMQCESGLPMLFRIKYSDYGGHAIVCDGWRSSSGIDYCHVNYGWGGPYTAWFAIDQIYHAIDTSAEYIIYNIKPPRTFVVCPTGTADYTKIQDAVDAAKDGDVIELRDAIYTGPGNCDISYDGKAILIRSQSGDPTACIIDPDEADRGFSFVNQEGSRSILDRVTIRDGSVEDLGGAIQCISSSPTIRRCIIEGNHAGTGGGGIFCTNSSPRVLSCVFRQNWTDGSGGAVFCASSSEVELVDCLFVENTADLRGGAINCENSSYPTEPTVASVDECVFLDNTAGLEGGGACFRWMYPPELTECTFAGNSVLDGGGLGGGVHCLDQSPPTVESCTFYGNSASLGGTFFLDLDSGGAFENTIISFSGQGKSIHAQNNSTPTLTCCDIYGNAGGDWVNPFDTQLGQNGNICLGPRFCDAANDNFKLNTLSPCAPDYNADCGLIGAWPTGCGVIANIPDSLLNGGMLVHSAGTGHTLGDDFCFRFEGEFAPSDCEEQGSELEFPGRELGLFYVAAAWNGEKDLGGVEFGLGDYDSVAFQIVECGPCFPSQTGLEIQGLGWPGPNSGVTLIMEGDEVWSGDLIPIYYFLGTGTPGGVTIIELTEHPETGHAGFFNRHSEYFPSGCLGAMGINTEGTVCCPAPDPPAETGVCCLADGSCTLNEEHACAEVGGIWHGGWQSCDPNPCGPAIAACCVGIECSLVTEVECATMAGTWDPDHDACDPNPCPTARDWADHNIGECALTVTDQGTVGFMAGDQAEGSGFIYPADGSNLLYIGSLWVGRDSAYVANNDYDDDPNQEWVVSGTPDGHIVFDEDPTSHQDILARYRDTAATTPLGLYVEQESWAYMANPAIDDFVMIHFTIENHGIEPLFDLYAGLFLDFDLDSAYDDFGGCIDENNLSYLTDPSGLYAGVCLLPYGPGDPPRANLTVVDNETYVWPNAFMLDPDKFGFLSAATPEYVLTDAHEPNDYSILASAGPFSLEVGESWQACFAILGGEDLPALQEHANVAQMILDGLVDDTPELPLMPIATRLLPNVPNPFSRTTMVRFELSHPGRVRISVYDVTGRLVRVLANGRYPASRHTLPWDGRDESERSTPGGVYFLRLQTDEQYESRLLIRLR